MPLTPIKKRNLRSHFINESSCGIGIQSILDNIRINELELVRLALKVCKEKKIRIPDKGDISFKNKIFPEKKLEKQFNEFFRK